ncbi:MAG: hypothetical protein WBW04_17755 [Nitrolancea sp.]
MSGQYEDRRPGDGNEEGADQSSSNSRKFSVGGVVGGAVMFVVLFVADKIRPSRRRTDDGGQPQQIPAADAPAAGTLEAITGPRPAPPGVHMAVSSPWPMVLAGAIAFTAFGVVTSYVFSLFGIVVMVVAIVGWVAEMLGE